jgi:hypothetical protein
VQLVSLYYYDNSGTWTIYAYAKDSTNNEVWNSSVTFTYQQLAAMQLVDNTITFGNVNAGSDDNAASENPYKLNNTGNVDFTSINITALYEREANIACVSCSDNARKKCFSYWYNNSAKSKDLYRR